VHSLVMKGCQAGKAGSAKQEISIAAQSYLLELTVIERGANVNLRWGTTLSSWTCKSP
jgi:hypothetical protein